MKQFQCADCKQVKPVGQSWGTGYASDEDGNKICYDCMANRDRAEMETGRPQCLYFTPDQPGNNNGIPNRGHVGNWSGRMKFPAIYSVGHHNWHGVKRYDVWFRDHTGQPWYGVCMTGGTNQSIKARRVKDGPRFPIKKEMRTGMQQQQLKRVMFEGTVIGYVIGNKSFFLGGGGIQAFTHEQACNETQKVFPAASLIPILHHEIHRLLFQTGKSTLHIDDIRAIVDKTCNTPGESEKASEHYLNEGFITYTDGKKEACDNILKELEKLADDTT